MSFAFYIKDKLANSNSEELNALRIMSLSKEKLLHLINSNSSAICLRQTPKLETKGLGLFQIIYNGQLLNSHLYCQKCDKIITITSNSTSNLSRHCKLHNRNKSTLKSQSANFQYNEDENEMKDVEHVTSKTIQSWKENGLLPREPELAIQKVYKIGTFKGQPSARVKWSRPDCKSTWIPISELKNYYIHNINIEYEDNDDISQDAITYKKCNQSKDGASRHKIKHLNKLQRLELKHM